MKVKVYPGGVVEITLDEDSASLFKEKKLSRSNRAN